MQTVNVKITSNEDKSYNIFIGNDVKSKIKEVFAELSSKKVIIVTNDTIYDLYKTDLEQMFEPLDLKVNYCIIPDGEQYKNQDSLNKILDAAFENKLERKDTFVAFGGGVVGDITGFAAATYLRGINFVQIPTTILAQVDSSVGGKVAIDNKYGKNLLGAFYQPKAVVTDLNFLKTLPKREILSGLSEVIKYSFIEKNCGTIFSDFAKFLSANSQKILNLDNDVLAEMIKICCELKSAVVNQDEKENGLRAILNFGHTIGHAIEKCTHYETFTHGEAISIGMRGALLISKESGKIDENYFNFANNLLDLFGLNFKIPENIDAKDIVATLSYDKKVQNSKIRFVLPVEYAEVEIFDDITKAQILKVIKELY